MIQSITFSENTVTVVTDGTSVVYSTAPVVTDDKVVVTHSDGTTEEFAKA